MEYDFTATKERIRESHLPLRYKKKLCSDLHRIGQLKPEGLQCVILFGSCARNQIRVGSDLDLLVITKEVLERDVRGELSSDLEEEKDGISTDVVFYTAQEFRDSECLLVKQIRKEGLLLWEV